MTTRTVRILNCDADNCGHRFVPDAYMTAAELRVAALRQENWTCRWERPALGVRVRLDLCGKHTPEAQG
jgi:hypothetical protein